MKANEAVITMHGTEAATQASPSGSRLGVKPVTVAVMITTVCVTAVFSVWLSQIPNAPWSKHHYDDEAGDFLATRREWEKHELPAGACLWQQGSIIKGIPTGPSTPNCKFQVREPEFLEILGAAPELKLVAKTDPHEGGVYYPDKNEFYFSSVRGPVTVDGEEKTNTAVRKVSLNTGEVTTVFPVTDVANGMVLDNQGFLLICQQGQGSRPGYIQRVDLKTLNTSVVADNWFGTPFNSPNDAVVKSDGSIWFTDPIYGWAQGFKPNITVEGQVYRIRQDGVVDAMASNFQRPNGLAFSEDEKRLYVTDTGFATGTELNTENDHHIYVYDVQQDGQLRSRQELASVGMYDGSAPGLGLPDGIYVACPIAASTSRLRRVTGRRPRSKCSVNRGSRWV